VVNFPINYRITGDLNMSLKKIEAIEKKIEKTTEIDVKIKEDLLDLMRSLKTELSDLKENHPDKVDKIVDKARTSAEKVIHADEDQNELKEAIDGLHETVEEFEVSHPKLVQVVNRICMMLSDIGI
jgi:mevalonate kinase